jgi:hypothetical protein
MYKSFPAIFRRLLYILHQPEDCARMRCVGGYPAGQVIIRCHTAEAHTGERGANVRRHPKRLFIYKCRSDKFVHISSRKYNEPSTPCERQSSLLVINLASVYTLLCGAVVQSVNAPAGCNVFSFLTEFFRFGSGQLHASDFNDIHDFPPYCVSDYGAGGSARPFPVV